MVALILKVSLAAQDKKKQKKSFTLSAAGITKITMMPTFDFNACWGQKIIPPLLGSTTQMSK